MVEEEEGVVIQEVKYLTAYEPCLSRKGKILILLNLIINMESTR